jgi:recombination directionality factor gp3-like protein
MSLVRVPVIDRQRALSRVGEIRPGGEKTNNRVGKKLDNWRLTSQHKDVIDNCAGLYGGTPQPWDSPAGEAWQLYTTTPALPCMVIVGYSLRIQYEMWEGASKCTRRCDGDEEQFTGGPCICNENGKAECDAITRLMVVLHETGTSLGWQLRSTGEIAADELAGAMTVAQELARGRAFVPATLRLTHRRGLKDGQTVRYVVPVLDFNPAEALTQISAPADGGYKALPAPVVTLQQGLEAVNAERKVSRSGRSAAPIGPEAEPGPESVEPLTPPDDGPSGPVATEPQRRKIFAIASERGVTEERLRELIAQVNEGNDSTKELPKALVDAVLTALDAEPGREAQTHFPIPRGARGSKR